MEFTTFVPGSPLHRFVDHFWFVKSESVTYPRQTLFPDGGITILINLGDPHALIDRTTRSRRVYRSAWIAGEREHPYLLESAGSTEILGIRFRPGGAFPFLPSPACELTGEVLDLDEVWDAWRVTRLVEGVSRARSATIMFGLLERELLTRLARRRVGANLLVERAVDVLEELGPSASIVKLAGDLGASHRHLLREFVRWVGLKPKMLQRILRFQRVIRLEDAEKDLSWSSAACSCGYYDQAHLIRDFHAFTGITPSRYRELRLDYPNYVPEL